MQEVVAVLRNCTEDNVDLILELHDFIREVAPDGLLQGDGK
jgi:hypothetical protein